MAGQRKSYQTCARNPLHYISTIVGFISIVTSMMFYILYKKGIVEHIEYSMMILGLFAFCILVFFSTKEFSIRFYNSYYIEYALFIPCKKVKCDEIKYISLSNASYRYYTPHGFNFYWQANKNIFQNGVKIKIPRAQIMVHKAEYPIENVTKDMTSYDIWKIGYEKNLMRLAGLFENQCLENLLMHTKCKFYVVGCTYYRHKKEFDNLFAKHPEFQQRMIVVT